jgi:predicted nuclease with TOPRIM domain
MVIPFRLKGNTMSTLKEKLAALGKKFNVKLSVEEPTTVKFIAAETADGKSIYTNAEAWGVGVDCYEDEAGTKPCADGEYVLANGQTVVVASGKVSEIKEKEEEMTTEEMMAAVEAFSAKLDETNKALEAANAELATIKEKFAAAEKKVTDLTADNAKLKLKAVPDKKATDDEPTEGKSKFSKQPAPAMLTMQDKARMAREKHFAKN